MSLNIENILTPEILFYIGATTRPGVTVDYANKTITTDMTYDQSEIERFIENAELEIQKFESLHANGTDIPEDLANIYNWTKEQVENLKQYRNSN